MRCYICNSHLSAKEGQFNKDHGRYDPCSTCLSLSDTARINETDREILEAMIEMDEDESKRFMDEQETDKAGEVPLS